MAITKLSIPMLPCTGPITIAGILTLHGRCKSSFLRGHGPTLLATTTKIRSRIHGELHQIIYNQASLPESDKRGKISMRNKPGKVIIGVVVGLCVIGVMSRRYEAQIMSPVPNFGFMSQVFENFMGTKQDESLADSLEKLDMLMRMAINLSKDSSDIKLEEVKAASGKLYLNGLKAVDQFIEEGKYEEAEKKCEMVKEFKPSIMDNSIVLRKVAIFAKATQAKGPLNSSIGSD
ncbi:hypothetical protein IHE45_05G109900 [Dioscorea alata]|uniref:Uncharacterized protein n=1 Tax=Dioscorea alata TaxID=55571 RepID=A0ACB7W423_DIOAL|nr:hypothetical protein IHE45_05G109900 [Dioscorea alata]